MSKQTNDNKRPTHAIWHVQGEGEKARWTRIGAAWMHKDERGANLSFDLIPMSGRTMLREIREQDDAGQEFNAASQGGAQ